MTSWMKNQLTKLYNAVSAPVAATRDALAERLQSVREPASLLYNSMVENMGYGQERLKDIVEKEAKEEQQQEEDVDLTRVLKLIEYWINEVPDRLKTKRMCIKALKENPWLLEGVPDCFKTQEMCNKAVRMDPWF